MIEVGYVTPQISNGHAEFVIDLGVETNDFAGGDLTSENRAEAYAYWLETVMSHDVEDNSILISYDALSGGYDILTSSAEVYCYSSVDAQQSLSFDCWGNLQVELPE